MNGLLKIFIINLQQAALNNPAKKAKELQQLANRGSLGNQKPILLYEAAREYMRAARMSDQDSTDRVEQWFEQQETGVNDKGI